MSHISPRSLAYLLPLGATAAHAHDGDHGGLTIATVLHWLTSPTHSLFAVTVGAIFILAVFKLAQKHHTR